MGVCGEGSMMTWRGDHGQAPRVSATHCYTLAVQLWADGCQVLSPSSLLHLWSADGLSLPSVTCTAIVDSKPVFPTPITLSATW